MLDRFIPPDKSWTQRMGLLDKQRGYTDIDHFLAAQPVLPDDLAALKDFCADWSSPKKKVRESGTLTRFAQYYSLKYHLGWEFEASGTLKKRMIPNDPRILELSQRELLDVGKSLGLSVKPTSQLASARALFGDPERLPEAKTTPSLYKLQLTYDAIDHWQAQRALNQCWESRPDPTLRCQAEAFLKLLNGERPGFVIEQQEDYCYGFMFYYTTRAEGEEKFPSLAGHESNRFEEMDRVRAAVEAGEEVVSDDHRAVQAAVMRQVAEGRPIRVRNLLVVNKTWPQFPHFILAATTKAL